MGGEILPGTGRGTAGAAGGGGGAPQTFRPVESPIANGAVGALPLHHPLDGPPPRAGEEFVGAAARLAGFAGAVFGWSPDAFWRATPAELAAVVRAMAGDDETPPDALTLTRLMEQFPDG